MDSHINVCLEYINATHLYQVVPISNYVKLDFILNFFNIDLIIKKTIL